MSRVKKIENFHTVNKYIPNLALTGLEMHFLYFNIKLLCYTDTVFVCYTNMQISISGWFHLGNESVQEAVGSGV